MFRHSYDVYFNDDLYCVVKNTMRLKYTKNELFNSEKIGCCHKRCFRHCDNTEVYWFVVVAYCDARKNAQIGGGE